MVLIILLVAILLLSLGAVGVLIRRNPLVLLMATEMMWGAAALLFILTASIFHAVSGDVFAFVIIAVAAAEVGIALTLIIKVYRQSEKLDIDDLHELEG